MSLSKDSHEFCDACLFFFLFKVLKKKYQLLFVTAQHHYLNPLLTCVINVCSMYMSSVQWDIWRVMFPTPACGENSLQKTEMSIYHLQDPEVAMGPPLWQLPRKRTAFPSLPFVHILYARSHNLSSKQEGIPDRIGCVTQNSSSPITQ